MSYLSAPARSIGRSAPKLVEERPDGTKVFGQWVRYPANPSHDEGEIWEEWEEPPTEKKA